jgi:sulfonate transport system permease protein
MAEKTSRPRRRLDEYLLVSLVLPVLLIVLWEVAGKSGWLNSSIFPPPSKIFESFLKQIDKGSLQKNILVSLERVALGYLLGSVAGITLGVITGLSRLANRACLLIFELLRPIPIIAWVPVLILWTGIGEQSKIIVIAIGTFWSVLINTTDGIRNVDKKYLEVSRLFMKSRYEMIAKVILPAALPNIFTGLRIGIGAAWLSVIGAELIAASAGLGFLISYSREMSQPSAMFVGVLTIGVIGCLINIFIRTVEKKLLKWHVETRG